MYFEPELRFLQNDTIEIESRLQWDILPHQHAFFEMAYIVDGQAIHTLGGVDMHVKKGDYFIIDYDAEHSYTIINNTPFELINVLFKPELIDKSLKNCRSFQEFINHYLIKVSYTSLEGKPTNMSFHDNDGSILKIAKKAKAEYDKKDFGYTELIRCHIMEIIIRTLRTISKNSESQDASDISSYIKKYIDKNYMNQITLSDISRELNFSLPYLSQKFKEDTGETFVSYLQDKRMEHSGRLIANSDKTIEEIAGLVGYSDVKFFRRVFSRYWKMTPREFKKAYRKPHSLLE